MPNRDMKPTDTTTLITALRVLSREIHCEDGVATAVIAEAADEIERLLGEADKLRQRLRLTDDEKAALERAATFMRKWGGAPNNADANTLLSMLARCAR